MLVNFLLNHCTMKRFSLTVATALLLCMSVVVLQSCIKDTYERTYTYTYYKPVYKTTDEVRANIRSNAPKAVEKPGKIYIRGSYIFLNDVDKGIHVIDNSNPAQPRNISFIDIPGSVDLAVKGNTLYADLFTDLVAIDISNPQNVQLKKVVEDVFPHRYYNGYFRPDSSRVIASWEKRDTTIRDKGSLNSFLKSSDVFFFSNVALTGRADAASVSPVGIGGSMARFTIMNDRMYTVGTSNLDVFNISNPENPVNTSRKNIGWNIETIYPFKDKLFIGSTTGMFIYSVSDPDNPVQTGQFTHVASCDPVIADDQYAYVTLRSGTTCNGFTNQLEVLQLNNLNPTMVKVYPMTNPFGLSKDGNTLFICDGRDGLKVYNASNVQNLQLVKRIEGIETYDVITFNGNAIVVARDGLYQYDYSDLNNIKLRSKITITK